MLIVDMVAAVVFLSNIFLFNFAFLILNLGIAASGISDWLQIFFFVFFAYKNCNAEVTTIGILD